MQMHHGSSPSSRAPRSGPQKAWSLSLGFPKQNLGLGYLPSSSTHVLLSALKDTSSVFNVQDSPLVGDQ